MSIYLSSFLVYTQGSLARLIVYRSAIIERIRPRGRTKESRAKHERHFFKHDTIDQSIDRRVRGCEQKKEKKRREERQSNQLMRLSLSLSLWFCQWCLNTCTRETMCFLSLCLFLFFFLAVCLISWWTWMEEKNNGNDSLRRLLLIITVGVQLNYHSLLPRRFVH
jgi:hypothetical protein